MLNVTHSLFRRIAALLLIGISVTTGSVVGAQSIPGESPDREVLDAQEKANELYERQKYDRALRIYKDDLAKIGDKYAQYMIGYMYFAGHGVPLDQVTASAWYRLAAERGTPEYVTVSDQLLSLMNTEQRKQSDEIFIRLKAKFGDAALLIALIREDIEFMRKRVKSDPFNIDSLGRRNYDRQREYYNRASGRAERRVFYLREVLAADITTTDAEWQEFEQLEGTLQEEQVSLAEYNKAAPP